MQATPSASPPRGATDSMSVVVALATEPRPAPTGGQSETGSMKSSPDSDPGPLRHTGLGAKEPYDAT